MPRIQLGLAAGLADLEDVDGDDATYQRISLMPRLTAGRFDLAFDVRLDLDEDYNLRDLDDDGKADDWSQGSDILYALSHLSYGFSGDPLRLRIGSIRNYTLGRGFIVEDFNNGLFDPYVRQRGALLDLEGEGFGFPAAELRFFTEDVLDWDIVGVRTVFRPLPGSSSAFLSGLALGGTALFDSDPQEVVLSASSGHPGDNTASRNASVAGADLEFTLYAGEKGGLFAHADYASITDAGEGLQTGVSYRSETLELEGLLRVLGDEFVPHYVDPYYELDRAFKFQDLDGLDDAVGYAFRTRFRLARLFLIRCAYEEAPSRGGARVRFGIATTGREDAKLSASLTYDRRDIGGFEDVFDPGGSLFALGVSYEVTGSVRIDFGHRKSFQPDGGPTDQTTVRTLFTLW
jgi:hypothetical protein